MAKQAIGADDVIASEIKFAALAVARLLSDHVRRIEKDKLTGQTRKYLERYARVVSESLERILEVRKDTVYEELINEINKRRPKVIDIEEPDMDEAGTGSPEEESEDVTIQD